MSTITTYADLKARVADFIARADLTERIPDFISLAEARLNRSIRAQEMQASTQGTLVSGELALPADYAEHLNVQWIGAERTGDLAYVEPDSPEWRFRYRPNSDPQMFTIMANTIIVRPITAGDVKMYYYKSLTSEALTDLNQTNWLLTKSPDLYLYTSLAEYNLFMKDDERGAQFLVLAKAEAEKESISTDTSKFMTLPTRPVDTGNQGTRSLPTTGGGIVG